MRFLANENFMRAGVLLLREAGHDVLFISEDAPSISDRSVMDIAILTDRAILTHDRDYGELIFRYGYRPRAGVIYFRAADYLPDEPARVLLRLLTDPAFVFEGLHTVVDDDGRVRQRRIPI